MCVVTTPCRRSRRAATIACSRRRVPVPAAVAAYTTAPRLIERTNGFCLPAGCAGTRIKPLTATCDTQNIRCTDGPGSYLRLLADSGKRNTFITGNSLRSCHAPSASGLSRARDCRESMHTGNRDFRPAQRISRRKAYQRCDSAL